MARFDARPLPLANLQRFTSDTSGSGVLSTLVTPGESGAWGSWVNIGAPLAFDTHDVILGYSNISSSGVDRRMLMQVGVYDGADYVVAATLTMGSNSAHASGFSNPGAQGESLRLPLRVPAGSDLSVRAMYHTTSAPGFYVYASRGRVIGGPNPPFSGAALDTIGVVEASVRGTLHSMSTSTAFSSWQELVASTENPYVGFVVSVGLAGDTDVAAALNGRLQIGDGSAIFADAMFMLATSEYIMTHGRNIPLTPGGVIPAGTSLQIRSNASGANAGQDIDISLIGVRP